MKQRTYHAEVILKDSIEELTYVDLDVTDRMLIFYFEDEGSLGVQGFNLDLVERFKTTEVTLH